MGTSFDMGQAEPHLRARRSTVAASAAVARKGGAAGARKGDATGARKGDATGACKGDATVHVKEMQRVIK